MQNFDKSTKLVSIPYEIIKNYTINYTYANALFDFIIIFAFIAFGYFYYKHSKDNEAFKQDLNTIAKYVMIANIFYALTLFNLFCSFDYLYTCVNGEHLHCLIDIHRLFVTNEFINYRNHTLPLGVILK
jgi:hypothetical protein